MANQQLVDYIKQQIQSGAKPDAIKADLVNTGWLIYDIEDAFRAINPQGTAPVGAQSGVSAQPASGANQTADAKSASGQSIPDFLKSISASKDASSSQNIMAGAPVKKKISSRMMLIIIGAVVLILAACAGAWFYFGNSFSKPNTQVIDQNPAPQVVKPLDMNQAMNASYTKDSFSFSLQNSTWSGIFTSSTSTVTTTITLSKAAFGDLNGDGNGDAAVILTGGPGNLMNLAVLLNNNGQPKFTDLFSLGTGMILESVSVNSGMISVSLITYGPNDPVGNPTQLIIRKFALVQNKLVEQATEMTGTSVFRTTNEANFEGKSYLTYEFFYPATQFKVQQVSPAKISITETKTSQIHILNISYEGGRGYSPTDYWNQIIKKNCVACTVASSTFGVLSSAATGTLRILNSQNFLIAENKTTKWIVWDSPSGTARLFAAQLQKPTDEIEKVLATFKFVMEGNASSTAKNN